VFKRISPNLPEIMKHQSKRHTPWHVYQHLLLVFFIFAAAAPLRAQTTYNYTGAGANNVWSTSGNWSNNVTPTFDTNAVLVFDYNFGANNILATGASRTVRSLVFGSGLTGGTSLQIRTRATTSGTVNNLTLNGGAGNASIVVEDITDTSLTTIQLGNNGGGIIFATDVDLTNDSASALLLIANAVSGNGALHKYGIGTAAFNRANTFSGGINIYEGTIGLYADAAVAGTGVVTLGAGNSSGNAVLSLGGSGSTALTYTNAVTVGAGSGTRTVSNLTGLSTANATLSGSMTLNKDVIFEITQYTANTHDRITVSGAVSGSGGMVKDGTGLLILSNAANSFGGLQINAGQVTLQTNATVTGLSGSGGSLALSGGTLTVNASADSSFAGSISGAGNLTKAGAGTLNLSNTATSFGALQIDAGRVAVQTNATITGLSGSGGDLALAGGTLTVNTSADSSFGQVISGAGALTKSGAGALVLSASNSYSGGTTLSAGVLRLGDNSALGTGTLAVTASSTLTSDGATARTIANAITLGSGTGNVALASGDATGAGALTLSGPVTLGGTTGQRIFTVNNETTVSGLISSGTSTGAVVKNGSGTLVLANTANTLTNNVAIQAGTVQVSKLSDKGTASSIGTMQGATFLQIGQTTSSAVLNYTGTGDSTDLQVSIGNGAGIGGASILNNGSGALIFSNAVFNVGSGADATANTRNLALGGTNTGANEIRGAIADITALNKTTQVVKNNTGTWILSGDNTYTGVTAVNAGALIINGNQTGATGSLTVASGATLGGSGTIGGATTISGVHSPGNSPGIQIFANGLTYASGSTFVWELTSNTVDGRGMNFDGVDVTGGTLNINSGVTTSLVFNGTGSTVLWSDGFWGSNQSWLVFDNVSAPVIGGVPTILFSQDNLGNDLTSVRAGSSFNWEVQGNDIYLNYVVPEPSTYALLVLSAAGLAAHVVRRRRNYRC
jgi:fibronectin-binding autotransporter adhesin